MYEIIQCKTKKKAKVLLDYLEGAGYHWISGEYFSRVGLSHWSINKSNTCYVINHKEKFILYRPINEIGNCEHFGHEDVSNIVIINSFEDFCLQNEVN